MKWGATRRTSNPSEIYVQATSVISKAFGPLRRIDLDRDALLLAHERTRERRADRDLAGADVRLALADDLVGLLLLRVLVDQRHPRAELDGVAGKLRDVDHLGTREHVLQLGDASLIVALCFFCRVVFRILRQVSMRARLRNGRDDARSLDLLAFLQFGLESRMARGSHRDLVYRHVLLQDAKNARGRR